MSALIKPMPIENDADASIPPGYSELCKSLGIDEPTVLTETRVLAAMRDMKIPRYDNAQVSAYMDELAWKAGKPWEWMMLRRARYAVISHSSEWMVRKVPGPEWVRRLPVPAAISAAVGAALLVAGYGAAVVPFLSVALTLGLVFLAERGDTSQTLGLGRAFSSTRYRHAVPMEHLANAALLMDRFPELSFFVTDYAAPNPDPFICCTTDGSWHIVFGVWDEPGFGGAAT